MWHCNMAKVTGKTGQMVVPSSTVPPPCPGHLPFPSQTYLLQSLPKILLFQRRHGRKYGSDPMVGSLSCSAHQDFEEGALVWIPKKFRIESGPPCFLCTLPSPQPHTLELGACEGRFVH